MVAGDDQGHSGRLTQDREAEEVVTVDRPIAARAQASHYFLRGLLRCRPCGDLLIPAYSSSGRRLYGCPEQRCPRPWIPAGETEERVWARFQALNEHAARLVPPADRQEVLIAVLNQISVGIVVSDLEYDWRD
jgi:hypothetical protein